VFSVRSVTRICCYGGVLTLQLEVYGEIVSVNKPVELMTFGSAREALCPLESHWNFAVFPRRDVRTAQDRQARNKERCARRACSGLRNERPPVASGITRGFSGVVRVIRTLWAQTMSWSQLVISVFVLNPHDNLRC
jgi:hypothetical protein